MKQPELTAELITEESLPDLLERQAQTRPDAIAISCDGAEMRWGQLDQQSNRLANLLIGQGARPGVRVGIFLERSLGTIVSILAVLKSGAAYLPIDPANPEDRLRFILEDSGLSLVITTAPLSSRLEQHGAAIFRLDSDAALLAAQSSVKPAAYPTALDLAYVIYTSGSTGKPKGVQITHGSVVHLLRATQPIFGFGPNDIWSLFHSCAFDLSVWEIFGCLAWGGRLAVVTAPKVHSPMAFYDLLERERVTILNQTPAGIQILLHWMEQMNRRIDTLALRLVICGGEALPTNLAAKVLEWKLPFWNFYGPTEATVWAACGKVRKILRDAASVPIGDPIPGYEIEVLNEDLQPVENDLGEIHISGPGLALGYWNRPGLTAERFISDSRHADPPRRLYKTGDIGRRLSDGAIEFVGRLDSQIKLRGFRIEVGEVEALIQKHPSVSRCIAVVDEERLAAFVLPHPGKTVTASELHNFAQTKLPDYMIPNQFAPLDQLPLTSNGKVDRRALLDSLRSVVPPSTESREELSERVRRVFEHVFEVPIQATDNFFELGGDSLLATSLCVEIERELGYNMRTGFLYEAPTARELAELLQKDYRPAQAPESIVLQAGPGTPLFCTNVGAGNLAQFRTFARSLKGGFPVYGLLAPGLDGGISGQLTFEEVAEVNIREVRKIQAHGPYRFAGASSGALLALEMAQQLTKTGEEVTLLAFLDATATVDEYRAIAAHFRVFCNLRGMERLAFIGRKIWRSLRKLSGTYRWLPPSPEAARVTEIINRMHIRYVPDPEIYQGQVVLFRAKESLFCFGDGGWRSLLGKDLKIEVVPGDHTYLFEEPFVRALAERVRRYLTSILIVTHGL